MTAVSIGLQAPLRGWTNFFGIEGRRLDLKKGLKFGAIGAMFMTMTMVFAVPMSAGETVKDWTVLIYLDGDNNLEYYADLNIGWIEEYGSDDNVNFVALVDTLTGPADLIYVTEGVGTSISVGADYGFPKEVNMGDPAVLADFVANGIKDYPAEKYAVILWDHGGGWRGICWDDTSVLPDGTYDFLDMVELRTAFADAYAETGVVLDAVAFDACLMAMPEVAYQCRDYAKYLSFSEETVPGFGFPYMTIAEDLTGAPEMDAEEFVVMIAEDYGEYYSSISGYVDVTMSAMDMAYMDELTAAVDYLGKELLASLNSYMNVYQNDMIQADRYYYPYNVDLKGFAQNLVADPLIKDQGIKEAANDVVMAVNDAVVIAVNSIHNVDSTGIAIYFPSTNEGMHYIKPTYEGIPFAMETSWYDFCYAFSNWEGRVWSADKL